MKYRLAKKLKPGDQVIAKEDNLTYMIDDIEIYGSLKKVRLYLLEDGKPDNAAILYNEDIV